MSVKELLELLGGSGADAYEITETKTSASEFYFIGDRLDQNRIRETRELAVNVYVRLKDGEELGRASGVIPATASRDEAKKEIENLIGNAAYAPNPFYELHGGGASTAPSTGSGAADDVDPAEIAKDFLKVMRELEQTDTEDINSFELFTERRERRIVNSRGLDVTSVYPVSMLEVVVNARDEEGGEIELYRMYNSGTCDAALLKKRLSETFRFGRDKLRAVPTPSLGKVDVLFSSEAVIPVYNYALHRVSAGQRYVGYSDLAPGKEIAKYTDGDRMTVTALASLPNGSFNTVYDVEGAKLRDRVLIGDGVMKAGCGSRQFSFYLGETDSFQVSTASFTGGTATEEELRQGTYLEAVEFSDFQVNPITGNFAGEIRLGYLHEGDTITIVSGGSISGSMTEVMPSMRMTRELTQYDCVEVPTVTRLRDVTVTGAG